MQSELTTFKSQGGRKSCDSENKVSKKAEEKLLLAGPIVCIVQVSTAFAIPLQFLASFELWLQSNPKCEVKIALLSRFCTSCAAFYFSICCENMVISSNRRWKTIFISFSIRWVSLEFKLILTFTIAYAMHIDFTNQYNMHVGKYN